MTKITLPKFISHVGPESAAITYQVCEEIGYGAFAKVFRIVRILDKKQFALKVISKETMENEDFKMKHFAEIAIQSMFDHDNIIKIIDNWKDLDYTYIVMELCKKGTLKSLLRRRGPMKEPTTAKLMRDVLYAVREMHKKNVIHKDLKLENFLLDDNNDVKITDFGISEHINSDRKEKVFAGTPLYMGPEVLALKEYGYQVDVWAVGVCTYELLTGQLPYMGDSLDQIYEKIKNGEFRFPNEIKLSFLAKDFIQSALQFKPERRPNIGELLLHPFINLAQKKDEIDINIVPNNISNYPINFAASPSYSVARFCDKTDQFGFGYLLKNGCIGACFNDYTRIIMDPHEEFVQMYSTYKDKVPILLDAKNLDPKEKHISLLLKFNKVLKSNKEMFKIPNARLNKSVPMTHVKYWIRKDEDVFFRFDNRVVQTNYADKKKAIIYYPNKKMVVFNDLFESGDVYDFNQMETNEEIKTKYSVTSTLISHISKVQQ